MNAICFQIVLFALLIRESKTQDLCGSIYRSANASLQYLTSPLYPDYYPSNLSCKWVITGNNGHIIQLIVIDFKVESGLGCLYDAVSVYDGSTTAAPCLARFCGWKTPTFLSSANVMTVTFETDGNTGARGFMMSYQSGHFEACVHKDLTSSTISGTISSPFYPYPYTNNADCTWSISTTDADYVVFIDVYKIDIEYAWECSADYLQAFDDRYGNGRSLGKWCGESEPSGTFSSGQYMFLRFHSNGNVRKTGFKLHYRSRPNSDNISRTYSNSGALPGGISSGLVFLGVIVFALVYRAKTKARKPQTTGQGGQVRLASILESSQPQIYTISNEPVPVFNPAAFEAPPSYDEVVAKFEPKRSETPPPTYSSLETMCDGYASIPESGIRYEEAGEGSESASRNGSLASHSVTPREMRCRSEGESEDISEGLSTPQNERPMLPRALRSNNGVDVNERSLEGYVGTDNGGPILPRGLKSRYDEELGENSPEGPIRNADFIISGENRSWCREVVHEGSPEADADQEADMGSGFGTDQGWGKPAEPTAPPP